MKLLPAVLLSQQGTVYAEAKCALRKAIRLQRRLDKGELHMSDLRNEEWYQLRDFHDGTLLYYQNLAIANFGHGMLQNEEKQVLHIGGSTDLSKFLRSTSDNWKW